MSYAYRKNRKEKRRMEDLVDPERKTIRNGIRRGKIPRRTQISQTGHYVRKDGSKTGKTFKVKRLLDSFGMIIFAKGLPKNANAVR